MTGHGATPRHRDHPAFLVLHDGFRGVTQSPGALAVVALDALIAAHYEVRPMPVEHHGELRVPSLHGAWPLNHPEGVVLHLWSDRGRIDITADELDELDELIAGARRRLAHAD